MPIYEYHCSKCGDFEVMQRMSDKPLAHCPTCRRSVTKLISTTSFQLKGSGWYITDYARTGDSKEASKGEDKKPDDAKATTDAKESASTPASGSEAGSKKGGKKKAKEKAAAA
jgi:putative FmdB family regulatory protein